jgi:hypothetical protein
MIPAKIIRFIEERATLGFAGTRDHNNVPCGHRVPGWQIDAAGRTLTAFFPESSKARVLEDVRDHGPIAITLEEVGTHETYQIKGRYLSHRPVRPAEMEIANRTSERFVKGVRAMFPDDGLVPHVRASVAAPSLAVEIEVHEVFVQTPGPGAGTRIAPPPDAERSAT